MSNQETPPSSGPEQMDKRIQMLENLYIAIDRKLWVIVILAVGAIAMILSTRLTGQ